MYIIKNILILLFFPYTLLSSYNPLYPELYKTIGLTMQKAVLAQQKVAQISIEKNKYPHYSQKELIEAIQWNILENKIKFTTECFNTTHDTFTGSCHQLQNEFVITIHSMTRKKRDNLIEEALKDGDVELIEEDNQTSHNFKKCCIRKSK